MPHVDVKQIDHLGIVAGFCDQVELPRLINELVGKDNRKVSVGHAVKAMIVNALGFTGRALYLTPMFFRNRAVDLLIDRQLVANDLNDASLGTALDVLYEYGVTELFSRVSSTILSRQGIDTRFAHLDSTTFSLHGEYDGYNDDPDPRMIRIVPGYSKDNNPELNQVVLQMICANRTTLPIWIEALSGNTSDRKSFAETVNQFYHQCEDVDRPWMVMDSAFYSASSIQACKDIRWVTRVPETLNEVKELYQTLDLECFTPVGDGYAIHEHRSTYGEVPQRWLVVFSQHARKREITTLQKRINKTTVEQQTAFMHLRNKVFSCADDALNAGREFAGTLKYQTYEPQVIEKPRYGRKGRPKPGTEPTRIDYLLTGELIDNDEAVHAAERTKGLFVIATNELDTSVLSNESLLSVYKDQAVSVERGFRFLKDPMFYAESLYLKSPKRIMALLMVMTLSLLVYSLAERRLREALRETGTTVWTQKKKPTNNPTLRWTFQNFEGVSLAIIRARDGTVTKEMKNLHEFELRVLKALGLPFQEIYFLA
jgi:transposase